MLRTMGEPLGEVCSVTRRLLRRGLGLQTSRCVNVFFLVKGRILFEQASYIDLTSGVNKFPQNIGARKYVLKQFPHSVPIHIRFHGTEFVHS